MTRSTSRAGRPRFRSSSDTTSGRRRILGRRSLQRYATGLAEAQGATAGRAILAAC